MEEKRLIREIQALKSITPRKEWISSLRDDIIGTEKKEFNFFPAFQLRPAYIMVGLFLIVALGTLIVFNQKGTEIVVAKSADYYLNIAESNLDRIIRDNFEKETVLVTIQDTGIALDEAINRLPDRAKSPEESEKIVAKINDIEEKFNNVKATITDIDINDLESKTEDLKEKTRTMIENEMYRLRAEAEIKLIEESYLTEEQRILFEEAKQDFKDGLYLQSLEKLLELTNRSL